MREWAGHKLALRNPPTDRMRDVLAQAAYHPICAHA